MLNFFYKKYNLFKFKLFAYNNTFFSSLYYDDLLVLTNPKLVKFLDKRISNSLSTFQVNSMISNNASNIAENSGKFDKKYRNSTFGQDFGKSKKLKSKLSKSKFKNSTDIDDTSLFTSNSNDLFNQDILNRSRKISLKSKKQNKLKAKTVQKPNLTPKLEELTSQNHFNEYTGSKSISLGGNLTIQELSSQISIPEAEIITYLFLDKGISVTINQILNTDIIRDIALHYKFNISEVSFNNNIVNDTPTKNLVSSGNIRRSPIVTILGHVDHGKTTLLDSILKTNLTGQESGGITQAIAGYEVICDFESKKNLLIFLDTPGHQSFKEMRVIGAKVTDIILLIIAVDDGVKPQTIEIISYIIEMNLSCIVVITKCDKGINNVEKIKQDLSKHGLLCEEWGGTIPLVQVSILDHESISSLLSKICFLANTKNLFADPLDMASGTILESYLDKKQGPIANIIVQSGTLKIGDIIAVSNCYGKVKNIINLHNVKVKSSGPASIAQILAFTSVPEAGLSFVTFKSEKQAKEYILSYSNFGKSERLSKDLDTRVTLEGTSELKQLKIILKTNTHGALEAILDLLSNISQSKVQINVIYASCGNISNKDIELALTTDASIIGFNVSILSKIGNLLKRYQIDCKVFNIIYDLFDYVEDLMLSLVKPEYDKLLVGSATVQTVFDMNKGIVAGCLVSNGKLDINSYIEVYRNKLMVYNGHINSLKRLKNDVQEVIAPNECGLMTNFDSWQSNDIIKAYELTPKQKTL